MGRNLCDKWIFWEREHTTRTVDAQSAMLYYDTSNNIVQLWFCPLWSKLIRKMTFFKEYVPFWSLAQFFVLNSFLLIVSACLHRITGSELNTAFNLSLISPVTKTISKMNGCIIYNFTFNVMQRKTRRRTLQGKHAFGVLHYKTTRQGNLSPHYALFLILSFWKLSQIPFFSEIAMNKIKSWDCFVMQEQQLLLLSSDEISALKCCHAPYELAERLSKIWST